MLFLRLLLIILASLFGSVPFGYILTKKGIGLNILEEGSGNIGSTNVRRVAGTRIAFQVQVLDVLKGLIPVAIALIAKENGLIIFDNYFIFLIAISTILGHDFSIFLHFKGGKGVNTTLGASLLLAPFEVLVAISIYFLVKKYSGYVSVGSIALAITLPATGFFLHASDLLCGYLFFCCVLILFRHIPNIKRLIAGEEFPK